MLRPELEHSGDLDTTSMHKSGATTGPRNRRVKIVRDNHRESAQCALVPAISDDCGVPRWIPRIDQVGPDRLIPDAPGGYRIGCGRPILRLSERIEELRHQSAFLFDRFNRYYVKDDW
jgi:hypothetical protein